MVAGALLLPALVFAQRAGYCKYSRKLFKARAPRGDKANKGCGRDKNGEWHDTLEQKRASTTNAIKAKREELHDVLKEKCASTTEAIKAKREEILTDIKAKREEIKPTFSNKDLLQPRK